MSYYFENDIFNAYRNILRDLEAISTEMGNLFGVDKTNKVAITNSIKNELFETMGLMTMLEMLQIVLSDDRIDNKELIVLKDFSSEFGIDLPGYFYKVHNIQEFQWEEFLLHNMEDNKKVSLLLHDTFTAEVFRFFGTLAHYQILTRGISVVDSTIRNANALLEIMNPKIADIFKQFLDIVYGIALIDRDLTDSEMDEVKDIYLNDFSITMLTCLRKLGAVVEK